MDECGTEEKRILHNIEKKTTCRNEFWGSENPIGESTVRTPKILVWSSPDLYPEFLKFCRFFWVGFREFLKFFWVLKNYVGRIETTDERAKREMKVRGERGESRSLGFRPLGEMRERRRECAIRARANASFRFYFSFSIDFS